MMDRRQFLLRSLLTTTGAALVPPSQLWPFRKIFLPPVVPVPVSDSYIHGYIHDMLLEWDAASGVYVIRSKTINALHERMNALVLEMQMKGGNSNAKALLAR